MTHNPASATNTVHPSFSLYNSSLSLQFKSLNLRSSLKLEMAKQCADLPDECWGLIFNSLDHHQHLELPSLVCNRFLSITNRLRISLTINDQTPLSSLPRILRRFRHLKRIQFHEFHADLDDIVFQIARSGLNLEELDFSHQKKLPLSSLREIGSRMKSLKVLKCSRLCFLQNTDLNVIANSLPWIEELDISYPENDYGSMHELGILSPRKGIVTDAGIEALSMKLRNLRKIDVSGNQFISDRSLFSLSTNCGLLREISVRDCCFVNQIGIGSVIRHCPKLISISVYGLEMIPSSSSYSPVSSPSSSGAIEDSLVFARALSSLDFSYSAISDEFLFSVARSRLPLKKLTLSHCYTFTFSGISSILFAYQSLTHLSLVNANFLTDQFMTEICEFLHDLTFINLNLCSKLTNSTFFNITKNCPLLTHIEMERANLGVEDFTADYAMNPRVELLKLARNMHLTNESIAKFVSTCPNLRVLDVSYCTSVTEQGIVEILNSCNEIRNLSVNQCGLMKNLGGMDLKQCSKLEVLQVEGSGINDDSLTTIAKRCPGLLLLDLEGCLNVTARGVMEVIKVCRGLKEINLRSCDSVSFVDNIVAWMVFSRPSLRRIILPSCGIFRTENQRNLFRSHGCEVC